MSQVTIYLDEDTLQAVRAAAARAHISVSKWFAQFAEAEKASLSADRHKFWQEIDALRGPDPATEDRLLDYLTNPRCRDADLGVDARRISFDD
ncbi:hypothetical protein [Diaphorobacter sp. JS3051]|uniref:hypothetical protein n=1 Tax=Diaphorobacter sp. JS3051 TaxID=2792224 RepID=UPI0018C8E484|nr:hypothetical protein [Diaphorobacter sp. JS3051]QPN30968.1 hypothetical protein I3K84_19860 [Diaphorobacter sp. JS3051]